MGSGDPGQADCERPAFETCEPHVFEGDTRWTGQAGAGHVRPLQACGFPVGHGLGPCTPVLP